MSAPAADTLLKALELVSEGRLAQALEHLERSLVVDPPTLASASERLRGCLAIRVGDIRGGFDLLERNRIARVTPWKPSTSYRFTVEATELDRVSRGLFECLAIGITPDAIAASAAKRPLNDFETTATLSHVRVLGRRLKLERRGSESKLVLERYRSWRDVAVAEQAAAFRGAFLDELKERLLRWDDRTGAREIDAIQEPREL